MGDIRLTPQDVGSSEVTVTRTPISTGNTYQVRNDGHVILNFRKTGAGNATITVTTPETRAGLAVADKTFTVLATSGDVAWSGREVQTFTNSSGDVEFTTDEGTDLTCAVMKGIR